MSVTAGEVNWIAQATADEITRRRDVATPSISGWSPPLIDDWAEGKRRIATQADIDELVAIRDRYSTLRRAVRDHFEPIADVRNARTKIHG